MYKFQKSFQAFLWSYENIEKLDNRHLHYNDYSLISFIFFSLFDMTHLFFLLKLTHTNLGRQQRKKSTKPSKCTENNALTVDYIHTYTKSKMRQTEMTSSHDIITPASENWHLYSTNILNTDLPAKTVERPLRK